MDILQSKTFRKVLTAAVAGSVMWGLYNAQVAPLREQEQTMQRTMSERREEINAGNDRLVALRKQQHQAQLAKSELDQLDGDLPKSASIVWLPQRLAGYFERRGHPVGVTRLVRSHPEEEITGYRRSYWSVTLPVEDHPQKINDLLVTVGAIEQKDPLFKVVDFIVRPNPDTPQQAVGLLSIAALVRE